MVSKGGKSKQKTAKYQTPKNPITPPILKVIMPKKKWRKKRKLRKNLLQALKRGRKLPQKKSYQIQVHITKIHDTHLILIRYSARIPEESFDPSDPNWDAYIFAWDNRCKSSPAFLFQKLCLELVKQTGVSLNC